MFAGETIAGSDQAFRVLETSHPPVYYLPPEVFGGCRWALFLRVQGRCEILVHRRQGNAI